MALSIAQRLANDPPPSSPPSRAREGGRGLGPIPTILAFAELLHPAPIAVVLAAASGFSAVAARGWPPRKRLLPFLAALLLTQLSISLHNDYCDRELDRRAKPWRAIPRGLVSPGAALGGAAALFAAGVGAAIPLGAWSAFLVALGSAAGLAYNAWFKRNAWTIVPFWIALPTLSVCAFVSMGKFRPRLLLAYLVGAPLVLAVYLADTLADVEADRVHGVRGLAHRLGPRPEFVGLGASFLGFGLAILATPSGRRSHRLNVLAVVVLSLAAASCQFRQPKPYWLATMIAAVATASAWLKGATDR